MDPKKVLSIAVCLGSLSAGLLAGVEVKEKSQMKFGGPMGKVMGLFGGKAAREGIISTSAVVGNRKLTRAQDQGQLIDLDEEKVYEIDWKKKTYQVVTFEEMRRRMQEAAGRMQEQAGAEAEGEPDAAESQEEGPRYEVDFDLRESGQTRNISGYECREVVMTITIREEGKTLEEAGGTVMTTNLWLTEDLEALKEVRDFDRRYAEKLGSPLGTEAQMTALAAMYPAVREAFSRFEAEQANIQGDPVLTVMTVESVAAKGAAVEPAEEEDSGPSLGGLFGGLGKKLGKKKGKEEAAPSQPGRSTLLTFNHEVVAVNPDAGQEAVTLPAGFKQR